MDEQTPFDRSVKEPPVTTFRADTSPSREPPMPPFTPPPFQTGGGWGEQSSHWFRENASSIALPLIALLVLGGGVYFYTRGRSLKERPIVEFQENAATQLEKATGTLPTGESPAPTGKQPSVPSATEKAGARIKLSPEGQPVLGGPELLVEKGMIRVVAQRGEGITHLARRAAREYVGRTNPGFTVTKEHKIFIEDFLKRQEVQKRTESTRLALGEEIVFSEATIKQAVEQARTLTDRQLKNLEQFSARVANL